MRLPLIAIAAALALPAPGLATTYTVTHTADSGAGSLRQAILNANGAAGTDTIRFNIGAGGLQTFAVGAGGLPDLTDAVLLDGTTQPGYAGTPLIQLNGAGATGSTAGINLRTNNATVRGFIIHSFPDEGLEIDAITGFGDNNVLAGNWVGIDAAGVARPNADNGVLVTEGADNNRVEDNVIASSGTDGLLIRNDTHNTVVVGNFIGVLADGVTARGNTRFGIELLNNVTISRVGGPTAAERNVVAHNGLDGIGVAANAGSQILLQNNHVFANTGLGIDLDDDGVTANDAGDGDAGANGRMNYPVIYSATLLGGSLVLTGEARPGAVVEAFEAAADPSAHGEGQTFVGRGTVSGATPGSVDATARQFVFSFPAGSVVAGDLVTATATDASNSTSEYSANFAATAVPLAIIKRSFLPGGTPLAPGTALPRGTDLEFLLYVNNPGAAPVTDVSLSDALAPGFVYIGGSLRIDASTPNCAAGGCTPAQEATLYTAVAGGTVGTDGVDGDVVSFAGATVRAGDQTVANARLDIPAGRVWVMRFRARMQ